MDNARWDDRLARWIWLGRPAATTIEERTRRRVWVHLVPILFGLYVLAYVDRSNIAVAKFGMNRSPAEGGLGFTEQIVGIGAGIFFWSYWILEIPSTLAVEKRGARWVFCRILVLWGLAAALMGFLGMPLLATLLGWLPQLPVVEWPTWFADFARQWNGQSTVREFYFLRLLLGFFEGGFFPTVVMYLSIWFRAEHRAKAMAGFMAAMPLSQVFGTLISQWISDHIAWAGMPGWRWIYIVEGIVPMIVGILVLFCLPDRPETAKWLPEDEKNSLAAALAEERTKRAGAGHGAWKSHLGLVALLTIFYFCQNVSAYGISFFMPSIVKSIAGSTEARASLITSGFFVIAFIAMQVNGWHSDRKHERIWHAAWPMLVVAAGLAIVSLSQGNSAVGMAALLGMVGVGMYTHHPAFWSIPTMFLGSTAAASAIGFINMVGNFGSFVGPVLVGNAATKDDFSNGLWYIAPFPIVAAAIILAVGYVQVRKQSSGGTP